MSLQKDDKHTVDDEQPNKRRKITISNTQINEKFVGIINQGATCYLSSLLQVFYHLGKFRKVSIQYWLLWLTYVRQFMIFQPRKTAIHQKVFLWHFRGYSSVCNAFPALLVREN